MKVIETVYDGYHFRSRLEARWAVFFHTLGIKYQYEAEGYDLDGVWYLPDFWLPQQNWFVEIKGKFPSEEELGKVKKLSEHKRVYLLCGEIPNVSTQSDYDDFPEPLPYSGGYQIDMGYCRLT